MTDVKKSNQRLHKELKKLVSDTNELLGTTAEVADKAAKAARANVETSLKSVQEHIESGLSAAGDKAEEQLHVLDDHVRDNPYITMGISFAAGLIVGLFVGRT